MLFFLIIQAPIIGNQIMNTVVDMELEYASSQGLGDHDERFRVQTPPNTESIIIQTPNEPNNNNTQIELPLSESTHLINDVSFIPNIETSETSSKENNNIDEEKSKQIIIPNSSVDRDDVLNRSRDEFVKLLTKEAYISKSPSPSQTLNHRRRSYDDDDESNSNTNVSSRRIVTLVSNNHEDKLIIETTNIDQQKTEAEEEEEEQPTVKRIKVDLISPPVNNGLSSFILLIIYLFIIFFRQKSSRYTNR
jgi:hypothetical protein